MTVVNPKSISGINSITTGSGSDNLLTIHTSDASSTERVRINSSGDVIVGSGITVSPDGDIFATGVTTSTTFVGALTGNVTGTASGNAALTGSTNNTVTTVTGANAIQGEANLTFDGDDLLIKSSTDGRRISFASDGTSHYMKYDNTLSGIILNGYGGIAFETNGTNERLRITSGGDMGVGTNSPDRRIHCHNSSNTTNVRAKFSNGTTGEGGSDGFEIGINGSDPAQAVLVNYEASSMAFFTSGTERMSISSGGELKFDTGTRSGNVNSICAANGHSLDFNGTEYLYFRTANSESMRINSGGDVFIGTTTTNPGIGNYQTPGTMIRAAAGDYIAVSRGTGCPLFLNRDDSTGTLISLRYNATERGTIQTDGTNVVYNTSSDYRLKENIVNLTGAIDRLKTLSPKRFNFKELPSKTVDGFLAHEVTAVPEAITGTKDEIATTDDVDRGIKKGDPIYQGIDQSKLVPLLTAALKEAITKIETLESEVSALKSS